MVLFFYDRNWANRIEMEFQIVQHIITPLQKKLSPYGQVIRLLPGFLF